MTVLPLSAANGLSHAELASVIIFAAHAEIPVETGLTEEGWAYAALDLGTATGGDGTWTISREKRRLLAFNEREGVMERSRTVADVLALLSQRLPANQARWA